MRDEMRVKRAGIVMVALVAGLGMLVGAAHAPFARRIALSYTQSLLQRNVGLTLSASRLDYNLIALRAGLAGVRVSVAGAEDEPFFEAEYVAVTVWPRALLGDLAIRDLTMTEAFARVHYRADGTSNLPVSGGGLVDEPGALPIDRLELAGVAVEVVDDRSEMALQLPSMVGVLTRERGSIAMSQPGRIRLGGQATTISELSGQATFDGRTLRLADARLRVDEATLAFDGDVRLLAREPSVELTVQGTGDIGRIARLGIADGEVPQGVLGFAGRITGRLDDPRAQLDLTSERIVMGNVPVTNLAARTVATNGALDLELLSFGVAGGRVTATASVPFGVGAEWWVDASWSGVDLARATRLAAPDVGYVVTGRASGALTASGVGGDVTRWQGTARVQVGGSGNAPGRLAVPGETTVTLNDGEWRLAARHALAGVAPVAFNARGRVPPGQALADLMMNDAVVTLAPTLVGALASALRDVGLVSTASVVTTGSVEATLALSGRVSDPEMSGRALARGLAGDGFDLASMAAEMDGHPLRAAMSFAIEAPSATVSGQALRDVRATGHLTRAAGPGRGVSGGGRAETSLVLDAVSANQIDGPGRLSGSASYDLSTGRYSTSIDGVAWQWVPTDAQPASGSLDLHFAGTGTIEAPGGAGEILIRDAAWQGTGLGELSASVVLDGGRAVRIEARAPEFGTTATARVQIAAPYEGVVDVHADRLDLARALRDVTTPTPVGGVATGSVHAEGTLDAWRAGTARVELASFDATIGQLPVRLAESARVRYEAERILVDRLEATIGETTLSASGALPVFDVAPGSPGVLVVMTGGVREVALAVAASGLTEVPITGGRGPVALLARVAGSLASPVYEADLEVGPGSITLEGLSPVFGLQLKMHAGDGQIEFRDAVAHYQSATISASGAVPLAWMLPSAGGSAGGGTLQVRASNVTAAVLVPFIDSATASQVSGSLDATLDASSVTPEISAMTGHLQVDRLDVRVGDLPITQRVPTRIVARGGIAHVEAWDWAGQGATLGVSGQVGLKDRQMAMLANGHLDLRVLSPFTREAGMTTAGRLESLISFLGPLDSPRVEGEVTMTGGQIRLADPRVFVSELGARATLNGTSATITSVTGSMNGGVLTGSGSVGYSTQGMLIGQLSATVRGMALEFPEGLRSEVDGDLALVGGVPAGGVASGRLSGTVTVVRGSYREPLAVVTGLLARVRTPSLAAATEVSPLRSALALDVRLVTDDDIVVDNNYGRMQLGADLRVVGTAAAPSLSGRADVREGGQLFIGRNVYAVTVGAIDFANPVVIEPNLNIQASTRAGGEDIDVRITGLAESPSVDMRSTSRPDLGQAEVASLLLTGRRLEDLAPGDAAFVGTQVLGNVSGEVLGFASRAVGLDTLRFGGAAEAAGGRDPAAAETTLDPTTRLTFGKSIGPDVDVTFSQSLRNSDAQAWIVNYAVSRALNDGRRRPWLLEYVFRRGLELRLVSDDDDLRSYGFRHDVTFGAVSRPMQSGGASRVTARTRVADVTLSGDLALSEARVREELHLKPGGRFDYAAWQADRDRLEQFYRTKGYVMASIAARRSDDTEDVTLAYAITAGPRTRIVAVGMDVSPALRVRLEDAWAGSVSDEFLTVEASQLVRADLTRQGYLRSMVAVRVRPDDTGTTLEITVELGPRSARTVVRIEGVREAVAREMDLLVAARGVADAAVSDPSLVEREVASYLRARGYLRARVTAGAPVFEAEMAVLPVGVDTGAVFSVGRVVVEGTRTLSAARVLEIAGVMAGAPYDPGLLEGARDAVAALYRREGFRSGTVAVGSMVSETAPTVDVTFTVTEGARDVLAEVVVVGNRSIGSDIVARDVNLVVGVPLRAEDVLQARTRVFGTGLFRRLDIAAEPVDASRGGDADIPVRLHVTVEEWPALRLRYGFLVAEERNGDDLGRSLVPALSADVSRRTLFGRAVGIGAAVGLQQRERRGRLFVNTPTLFGLPVESSLVGEKSQEEFEGVTFVTDRSRVTWEQRARAARHLSLSYAYTFEKNRTFDTNPNDADEFLFDIRINIARLAGAIAWDTRNDPLDTSRGVFASSGVELASETLGSDIRFVRQVAQAYYFQPWRGVVFASAARLGVVTALGDQDVIPSERFFAGGSGTVRGVMENGLGPVDDIFSGAAGGNVMVVFNQEARMPLYRWVRGVAFVDVGNVFAEPRDARLRTLVGSLGVGLRFSTPVALLRVDYARSAWGLSTTTAAGAATPAAGGGRWTFGIGHAF